MFRRDMSFVVTYINGVILFWPTSQQLHTNECILVSSTVVNAFQCNNDAAMSRWIGHKQTSTTTEFALKILNILCRFLRALEHKVQDRPDRNTENLSF